MSLLYNKTVTNVRFILKTHHLLTPIVGAYTLTRSCHKH